MIVTREREAGGLVIEAETKEDAELLAYLWCNRTKVAAFERKPDGLTALTIAPTFEDCSCYDCANERRG